MRISIFVYDGFTALDAFGPYEVLWRLPGAETSFVGIEAGLVHTDNGIVAVQARESLAEIAQTDVLVVPGGPRTGDIGRDPEVQNELRRLDAGSRVTAAVCTGSLILAAAGILAGRRATTHWAFSDQLSQLGAERVAERTVVDGKYYSAAGVSAGIDMALLLAADLTNQRTAETIQLGIEYDPRPPFDAGSPTKAPPEAVAALRERFLGS